MSLDIELYATRKINVFELNITHNLARMASVPIINGKTLYHYIWKPEELNIEYAGELIVPLSKGLEILRSDPEKFKEYNPSNGWGDYDGFVNTLEQYLEACIEDPDAKISTSR